MNGAGIGLKVALQPLDREALIFFGVVDEPGFAAGRVFTDAEGVISGGNGSLEDFREPACGVLAELTTVAAVKGYSPRLRNHWFQSSLNFGRAR